MIPFIVALTLIVAEPQYTIVIFTAKWCGACQTLKRSIDHPSNSKIIKEQYSNDIFFINTDDKNNQAILRAYLKYLKQPTDQVAIPMIFILSRPNQKSPHGTVLRYHIGGMSPSELANFLDNPRKYQKKP